MTGGAFKNSSNLLSRRREIEEFEKTVAMLKKDMDAADGAGCKQRLNLKRAGCYNMVDDIQSGTQKGIGHRKYSEDECRADEDAYGGGKTKLCRLCRRTRKA